MNYVHLRRFLDKVRSVDSSRTREFVMTTQEAQGLHTDITKLLTDLHELSQVQPARQQESGQSVELTGGNF